MGISNVAIPKLYSYGLINDYGVLHAGIFFQDKPQGNVTPGCNQFWIFGMSWTCHYEKMTVWS